MNMIASILLCLVYIGGLNAQMEVCAYEPNIDYYISVVITYVYTKQASYCCSLCGLQPGCIGEFHTNDSIESIIYVFLLFY